MTVVEIYSKDDRKGKGSEDRKRERGKMSTAAAIYIGAYTIQMLIARLEGDGEPEIINEFTAYTRIGEDLSKNNLLFYRTNLTPPNYPKLTNEEETN